MMPNDLPEGTPGWLVLAAVIIVGLKYLFQFLSEMSESASKFFGPLGHKWRTAAEARRKQRSREKSDRADDLEEDVAYYKKRADQAEDRADLAESRAEAADTRASHFIDWYQEIDAPFHRDLRIKAAESGCEVPPWSALSRYKTSHLEGDPQ